MAYVSFDEAEQGRGVREANAVHGPGQAGFARSHGVFRVLSRPHLGHPFAMGEPLAGGRDVDEVDRWRDAAWSEARRRLGQ
jgi:hypothetical protein